MKILSTLLITTSTIALAACEPDYTESEFVIPSASGTYVGELDIIDSTVMTDGAGNGFSYAIGFYPAVGDTTSIKAIAGLLPGTSVTEVPTSGTASYHGVYGVAFVTDISVSSSILSGYAGEETGSITLNADFSAGTLKGSAGGLTVNGEFSGTDLNGTVEFNGLTGELDGLIGGDATIGVFHGNDDDDVFAGGFGAGIL